MKGPTKILIAGLFLSVGLGIGQGCSPSFAPEESALQLGSSQPGAITKACAPPQGVSGVPKTIEEAVALINALPRPVTVACFVESLDRPLNVSLTNNQVSAQPAVGNRSPRIFIMIDKLFISVVPEGLGRDYVEFSYLTAPDLSIKAEIEFPVTETISAQAPYDRVLYAGGTSCGFCHKAERRSTLVNFATAFESKALQPPVGSKVDLEQLRREVPLCDPLVEPVRCAILSALFNNGTLRSTSFPSTLPYF